ncbi:S1 domain-containing post-transcriptional regulator GSP13 [Metabacillus sp. 84]|uniref:S1 domain-containing post-transcriptional regulator GSP13 n=1 Tax=Metabacillus sp. 84 TaxID=3404705 RepID=UPI003CFA5932
MTATYEVGNVYTGKITGIQPYGAFVALDGDTQGLVHISEVTHSFVKDINEHLKTGEEVQVKVLSIDEKAGKMSLSIRATQEAPERPEPKKQPRKKQAAAASASSSYSSGDSAQGFNTLKEKLEEWIEQSKK